ncbi:MAG: FAD-dependent oxidoreductase [Terriglobia bacterium]
MTNVSREQYDFIVAGAGAAGSVLAAELSASGAQVVVIESGGPDDAPTIANPSVWFYNVGGPLDYHLPVNPSPRLNNRTFNMALGHVLGGGSSINAMVWTRGMQRDYDGWAENGAKGWAFADVLPVFKSQEDWEGGANAWRGAGGPIHIRRPKDPHPTAPAFIDAAREMGMPILDDVNGPMVPGAGYINMNIAADGTRVSAASSFLRPALSRPNLTLLLNATVVKLNFKGTRCVGVKLMTDGAVKDIAADKEVILAAGAINTPKLLMLSGVGEAQALRSLGIEVVENLPGVVNLHECSGMDEAIRTGLLLPGNLGEASAVGPWRNITGSHCLHRDVIPEDETKCVVVAAIGETDRFPGFEIGIEGKLIELRLHRCESNRLHLSTRNGGG